MNKDVKNSKTENFNFLNTFILDCQIYSEEAIKDAIKEFSNICKIKYSRDENNDFVCEIVQNDEYDTMNIIDEFRNYVLSVNKFATPNTNFDTSSVSNPNVNSDVNLDSLDISPNYNNCQNCQKCNNYKTNEELQNKENNANKENKENKRDTEINKSNENIKDSSHNFNLFHFKDKRYIINFYRFEKFANKNKEEECKYLITNEESNFLFLTKKEYEILKKKNFVNNEDEELLFKLMKNNFVFLENKFEKSIARLRKKKDFLFQGPSLHIIVLTKRCNLKCLYCDASAENAKRCEYDMNKDTAKKTVDRIFETQSLAVTIEFQGGEPLLNFDIMKFIIEYATEKNKEFRKDLRFALVSNFVAMTDEILDFCVQKNVGLCTSLDGPKEVHNYNRGGYDTVSTWINKIQKRYKEENRINKENRINNKNITYKEERKEEEKYQLNALMTITKKSLAQPKELVDEYLAFGLENISIRQLKMAGNAKKNMSKIDYDVNDFIQFWKECMDYIIDVNLDGKKMIEFNTKVILLKLFDVYDPNFAELRSPCGAATAQLLYDFNGEVYTCDEARMVGEDIFKLGDVNNSLSELINSNNACAIIASSINDTQVCDKCVFKPFCGICPVLNYIESGSLITNVLQTDRCKLLKAQFKYILDKLENDLVAKEVFMSWI